MLHADQNSHSLTDDLALLQRRLERERRARQQAEAVLEAKSLDLYQKHQELLRLNMRLEDRVKQRTEELADAVAKAQGASAAKGEFLARMSHEIRTPMNGVIGMLEALKMTSLQTEQADYLETAHTSATSLLSLINDILDFSKIEAGQMSIEAIRFDLLALLQHVVHLWEAKAQRSGLYLRANIDPQLPRWVNGDPTRLMQVLTNLVSNAIKFTHQGGVTVHAALSTESSSSSAGTVGVTLMVEDTGIGIAEGARARLFTAFMQADGSTSRRYGGTGLGLAICHQLMRLMNGSIEVQGEQDRGTRFVLRLDFGVADAAVELPTLLNGSSTVMNKKIEGTDDTLAIRKGKVLVVDDNDTNRKVALIILKRFGIEADSAENGQQAIQAVQSQPYDVVLMDCHMPVVDGYEATTAIRAWEKTEQRQPITIVAVTASAFQEDRDRCAACGMSDFVAKPINLRAIGEVLQRWLPVIAPATTQDEAPKQPSIGSSNAPNVTGLRLFPTEGEFDREQYDELREVSAGDFANILSQFHRGVKDGLQTLQQAVAQRNVDAILQISHRLKGSASTVGIKLIANECAQLEAEARREQLDRAPEHLNKLLAHYERVCHWQELKTGS